jgi:coenzyme Q-binding protein COQ10
MIEFKAIKILNVPIETLFNIVADIDQYPQFVPWCLGAVVIKNGDNINAQLKVGTPVFNNSYTSNVILTPYSKIQSTCDSGPLKSLKNIWEFRQIENGVEAKLMCTFELSSFFLNAMMSKLIKEIASKMIDAFEKRALEIVGKR